MHIWDNVLRAEFDNTVPGRISGTLWLSGSGKVQLELSGNCYRDLAGCRFSISNEHPRPDPAVQLYRIQKGIAGLFTASLKYRRRGDAIDSSADEASFIQENRLYLEWYSAENGRLIIESAHFQIQVTPSSWALGLDDELEQLERNQQAKLLWERLALEAEEAAAFLEDHNNKLKEEDWDELLEEQEVDEEEDPFDDPLANEVSELYPDEDPLSPLPGKQGVLWAADIDGTIHHPLVLKCRNIVREVAGLTCQENDDEDVQALVDRLTRLSNQLEGFLDHLCYHPEEEPIFLVSCLKRALRKLNAASAAAQKINRMNLLPLEAASALIQNLFSLREDLLTLVQEMRNQAEKDTGSDREQ